MTRDMKTVLDGLNLVDKFLFDETMENPEVYSATVSILLEQEIELLSSVETEKELRISPQLRAIRLDVIGMDRAKKIFYTEMQKRDTRNLQKRSRYYQAQVDVSLLEPGCKDFNNLSDACFILVAPFDIFGKGLYRYTFEGRCRECPDLVLEDGAVRIFINTNGTNKEEFSQEFVDFMEYINFSTDEVAKKTESDKIKMIHENVKQIKASEKVGVRMMQHWEELAYEREDARAEGRAEGIAEGRAEGIAKGRAEGIAEGKTEGKAEDILILLGELGTVPEELRQKILQQKNNDTLIKWLKMAARAESMEEFLKGAL